MPSRKSSGKNKRKRENNMIYESLTSEDFLFAKSLLRRKDLFNHIIPRLGPKEITTSKKIISNAVMTILGRKPLRNFFTFYARKNSKDWDDATLKEWVENHIVDVGTTRTSREKLSQIFEKIKGKKGKKVAGGPVEGGRSEMALDGEEEKDGEKVEEGEKDEMELDEEVEGPVTKSLRNLELGGVPGEEEEVMGKEAMVKGEKGVEMVKIGSEEKDGEGRSPGKENLPMARLAGQRTAILVIGKGRPAPGA